MSTILIEGTKQHAQLLWQFLDEMLLFTRALENLAYLIRLTLGCETQIDFSS